MKYKIKKYNSKTDKFENLSGGYSKNDMKDLQKVVKTTVYFMKEEILKHFIQSLKKLNKSPEESWKLKRNYPNGQSRQQYNP